MSEHIKVRLAKNERQYIKVYKDFFRCELLDTYEKIVYIGLKDFLNYYDDAGEVFPSIMTLAKNCNMDRKTVIKVIKKLESKGVIKKERRGLSKTNIYILNDNPDMWKSRTVEEMQAVSESKIELSTDEMLEELKRRGVIEIINTKKELNSADQSKELSPNKNLLSENNNSINIKENQEKYTIEDIKELFDYGVVITSNVNQKDVDAVFNILYDTLNTTRETIRVMQEDKPKNVVISKLIKLTYEDIVNVIIAFNNVTEEIKNPRSYMLTQLYLAKEQNYLKMKNIGHVNKDF